LSGRERGRMGRGWLLLGGELKCRRVLLNSSLVLKSQFCPQHGNKRSNDNGQNPREIESPEGERRRKGIFTCDTKQIKILQYDFLPRSKQDRQIPIPRTLEKAIKSFIRPHHI
jgi:hypothetical protein